MSKDFSQLNWDAALEDDLRHLVRLSVREELDRQYDWTTVALVNSETQGKAAVVARESGILAGLLAGPVILDEMQADIDFVPRAHDGNEIAAGAVAAELSGSARDMLTCERPLLNLICRLSGIATLTRRYVERIVGTSARIYDTRKTTLAWRRLEKYAVRCGGGCNHRTGLYDGILIKDNHLLAADGGVSPANAVRTAREFLAKSVLENLAGDMLLEVEVDRLEQLDAVLAAGPDIILLDNMTADQLRDAVARRDKLAPQVQLEASGGVSLETVSEIAQTGVERISVGGLTHAARWLDLGLDWQPPHNR